MADTETSEIYQDDMSTKAMRPAEEYVVLWHLRIVSTLHHLIKARKDNGDISGLLAHLQGKAGHLTSNSIHIMRSGLPMADLALTPGPRKTSYMIDCRVAITGNHCAVRLEANSIDQYVGHGNPIVVGNGYYSFRSVLVVADNKKANNAQTLEGVVKQTWGILMFGFMEGGVGNMVLKFYDKFGSLLAGVRGVGYGYQGWIIPNGSFKFKATMIRA